MAHLGWALRPDSLCLLRLSVSHKAEAPLKTLPSCPGSDKCVPTRSESCFSLVRALAAVSRCWRASWILSVLNAANLFQRNGLFIRGEPQIIPEDPVKTTIVGNFEFDYTQKRIDISQVPWHKRVFRVAHNRIEHDSDVWAKVEELILDAINNS